ncbi:MAG: hypothetical protein ACPGWR_14905 [Ardenticatenaceae bacterium]
MRYLTVLLCTILLSACMSTPGKEVTIFNPNLPARDAPSQPAPDDQVRQSGGERGDQLQVPREQMEEAAAFKMDQSAFPHHEATQQELMSPRQEPLDAVAEWMNKQPATVANTTEIRQELYLNEQQAPVLLSVTPTEWHSSLPALVLFEIEQNRNQWITTGHDYNRTPELIHETFTFHNHYTPATPKWAAAYGWVVNDSVTHVSITWSDGLQETVSLQNGTYLIIRTDNPSVQAVQVSALDTEGHALAEYTNEATQS